MRAWKNGVCAAAVTLLAAGFNLAMADEMAQPRIAKVSIRDLDLTSESGRAEMMARVRLGVRQVCAGKDLTSRRNQRSCQEATLAGVKPQLTEAIALAERNTKFASDESQSTARFIP